MSASSYPGLALPKPEARARAKARADRKHAAKRKRALLVVYAREEMRCQRCRMFLVEPFSNDAPWTWAQAHERIPRSLGGSDVDPDNMELLCARDHNQAQRERKR